MNEKVNLAMPDSLYRKRELLFGVNSGWFFDSPKNRTTTRLLYSMNLIIKS